VTKRNLFSLIPPFRGKKERKNIIFTFVHNFIPNKRLVMIATLSLSLSLSLSKIIKLNSSSTFLGEELTQESAGMIGQKVQFLL
jgi:hypothetical protein